MQLAYWVSGLLFSLVAGGAVVPLFRYLTRRHTGGPEREGFGRVPSWVTGSIERLVFAVLVGNDIAGTVTAMMAWLGLKMATNWNRDQNPENRADAFTALLAGLISMFFAFLGGRIAAGKLWAAFVP